MFRYLVLIISVLLLLKGAAIAQTGSMSLDHVDGLYAPGQLSVNTPIVFHIKMTNNYGVNITGFTTGFRIHTTDDAQWASLTGALTGVIGPLMMEQTFINHFSNDGLGADTVGFAGFRLFAPGIPDGFDDIISTITIGPIDPVNHNKTLCLDSSYYRPAGAWAWSAGGADIFPSWSGPHCYTIFDPSQPSNQPPILDPIGDKSVDENSLLSFTISAFDPNGDVLTYSMTSSDLPPAAIFNPSTRVFSWTPTYENAGVYHATFTVNDGTETDDESITITVFNVNRPPSLNPIGDKATDENVNLSFTVSGVDPDGDALTFAITATNLPAGYSFINGVFNWTPNYQDAGVYFATIEVTDGLAAAEETINITVNNVNRAPNLNAIGNKTVFEESLLQFNVTANDPDSDPLIITMNAPSLPPAAAFDGSQFNWTPAIGDAGVYEAEFVVSDGDLTDSETILITINEANLAPYFEEPLTPIIVNEGETIIYEVSAIDPNADDLSMSISPVLPNMTYLKIGLNTIRITFSPNCSQASEYLLQVFASDGQFTAQADLPVTVLEACQPIESGTIIVEPDPIKYIFSHLIYPIPATIYLGDFGQGYSVTDVDLNSFVVNGSIIPLSATIEPSHPMFVGEVIKVDVSMSDFIHSYPILFDTSFQICNLTGSFLSGDPIDVFDEFNFIGKLRGDVNLDGMVNISDITAIVDYFFQGGPEPSDRDVADVNIDNYIGIADLTKLVNFVIFNIPLK